MKIAVTGASGQIGVCLVKELLKEGHEVKALIYDSKKGLEDLNVEFVDGNILKESVCIQLCADVDVVFHLAAIVSINGDPKGNVWNVNVNGTRNILNACIKHKVKKLVHFSSIHAYSTHPVDEPLDENRPLAGGKAFPYEKSKAEAQKMVLDYVRIHQLDASIINPTGVLGIEDHLPSIKGKLLIDFYNGKIPMLMPGGFDWVDTRDLIQTSIAAMHRGDAGECYLASGKYYTLVELAEIIGLITQKKMPSLVAPIWLMKLFLPFIYSYGKITRTEPLYTIESLKSLIEASKKIVYEKAAVQLGHSPRPIHETIADSYDWFRKEGFIN
ncbi:MAG: NAD-dependent epimerase/dehydratase family protein [Bacteroidetes bacterium]|nr:NAD-dependent epimerase/dehydratase family protein [Bacteroidota bacterium]